MTLDPGPATRLTIYLRDDDQWHHRPLYTEIVHRAHRAGLAGASVFHGIEGFGSSDTIHTSRILSLGDALPCVVFVVDREDRVRAFLHEVAELLTDRLVTLDRVEIVAPAAPEPPR